MYKEDEEKSHRNNRRMLFRWLQPQ